MTSTCRCGKTWSGLRTSHCTVCHQTFAGDTIGDAHQVGEHTPDTRRCLSEAEMTAKGWRLVPCATGDMVWHGPAMSDELKAKRFGVHK